MTISAYHPKLLHPLFPHFCPCRDCPYYLDPDNYITLDGTTQSKGIIKDDRDCTVMQENIVFPKLPIHLYLVQSGSFQEYIQTAKMSSYGLSTEQIALCLGAR